MLIKVKVKVKSLSPVWLFVTPRTLVYQDPPSMGYFNRQRHVASCLHKSRMTVREYKRLIKELKKKKKKTPTAEDNVHGFPCGSDGNESTCSAGDPGSILWPGRSPGEGNGCSLQYSYLENPMDWIEEPGRLLSVESQRVRHDWATDMYTHTHTHTHTYTHTHTWYP